MKYTLIIILFAACGRAIAQADTANPIFTIGSVRTGTGTYNEAVSIMLSDDSAWEIKGDSLAAIKLLWSRWHEACERESKTWAEYDQLYKSYEAALKGWQEIHKLAVEMHTQKTELLDSLQQTVMVVKPEPAKAEKGNPELVKWTIGGAFVLAVIIFLVASLSVKKNSLPLT